jgi:hypothetical protein
MSLLSQQEQAQLSSFQLRVMQAAAKAALDIYSEWNGTGTAPARYNQRAAFAQKILLSPASYAMSLAINIVSDGVDYSKNDAVTDAALYNRIAAIWNAMSVSL